MKKIYFAALAMALTACVSNEDLNPVDNYGYIDVNVSNDPVMVTRAEGEPNWIISATKNNAEYSGITVGENKVPEGEYVITAKSHESIEEANIKDSWGQPFYLGKSEKITISAGQRNDAGISCGKAKNSKVTASFDLVSNFSNCVLTLDPDLRELQISKNADNNNITGNSSAFFSPGSVNYKFSYSYNNGTEITSNNIEGQLTCEAGNEHYINITSDDKGTLTVTITFDPNFTDGTDQTLTFDAATGEQVTNS